MVSLACLNFQSPNWINKAFSPWEVAFNKHDFSISTHSRLNRKYPSVVLLNISGWSEQAEVFYKVGVVAQVSLEKINKLWLADMKTYRSQVAVWWILTVIHRAPHQIKRVSTHRSHPYLCKMAARSLLCLAFCCDSTALIQATWGKNGFVWLKVYKASSGAAKAWPFTGLLSLPSYIAQAHPPRDGWQLMPSHIN